MLTNHTDRITFLKYFGYVCLMLAAYLLQSARTTGLWLLGGRCNILPFLVVCIALLEGPMAGGGFGFFAGTLLSLNSLSIEGLYALYLALFGILFGAFAAYYLRPILLTELAGGSACLAVLSVFRYFFVYKLIYGTGLESALFELVGGLLLSLPFGALCWLVTKKIHTALTEEQL